MDNCYLCGRDETCKTAYIGARIADGTADARCAQGGRLEQDTVYSAQGTHEDVPRNGGEHEVV